VQGEFGLTKLRLKQAMAAIKERKPLLVGDLEVSGWVSARHRQSARFWLLNSSGQVTHSCAISACCFPTPEAFLPACL
jgi:hypothetical protein